MYYFAQICKACIKNDGKLINIHTLDIDNISFFEKLTLCFPKIMFEETSMRMYLCQNCSDIVRKMYEFRELCVNSERILNTYVLQLEQSNSFQNSSEYNLKELMDKNYKELTMNTNERPKSELKLEKIDSEIHTEVIKTETLDVEYAHMESFQSNCLLDVKNEPVDIKPDCPDDICQYCRCDDLDSHANAGKDTSIQSPDTSETSHLQLQIQRKQLDKSGQRYKCDICCKGFNSSTNLKKHVRIHTGEKPYKCDVCSKRFNQSTSLQKHKRIHTGDKPYKCNICSKSFYSSTNLKNHIRTHTGEKPYKCDVCSKSFIQSCSLQKHIRIHTGEKPYECDVCRKRFNHSSNLMKHKRTHTGEKPYECDICMKCFVSFYVLQNHYRIHTGEKPFKCDVCSKGFVQSGHLQKHSRVHTAEHSLMS